MRRSAIAWFMLATLPAAADMLPLTAEQCAAVGQEPYASLAEQGAPLPPTPSQLRSIPGLVRMQQQAAVKETLLLRWALIRAASHRTSAAIEAESAGLARSAEAPQLLAELLQGFADGRLSRLQTHAWQTALESLLEVYGVDGDAVRLLVEEAEIRPDDVADLAAFLPLTDAFNMVPLMPPPPSAVMSDLRCMQRQYAALAELFAEAQDAESAARAAEAALPCVRELLTTGGTLFLLRQPDTILQPEQSELLKAANAAYARLAEQRSRLQSCGWFGNVRLRALDVLAE